jgi:RNA polymerase sigma-70 factor (ECF subfamily)
MQRDDDQADVARVLGGDVGAFEGIVRRWQRPLVNLAWRHCRDVQIAEDLAQEAFVKAFRALPRYRKSARFSTWLFAVALNHFRSHARVARTRAETVEVSAEIPDPQSSGVDEHPQAGDVRRAVRALPARYRDALLVHYFEDNDIDAASRLLAVPHGTLKARLHRARSLLERVLARPSRRPFASGAQEIRQFTKAIRPCTKATR